MLIALPLVTWAVVAAYALSRDIVDGWREAFLFAAVLVGLAAVLLVETTGSFHALSAPLIIGFWVLAAAGSLVMLFRNSGGHADCKALMGPGAACPGVVFFLLAAGLAVCCVTFIIAVTAAPNNWDSMTYHLPRVTHWLQERSNAFYPTNIPRQNLHNPAAEYILLHIYALTGGDRLLNLLQWAAAIGSAAGISLVAGFLGADLVGRALAGVVFLTVPMAILQASSTQTDLLVSFWIAAALVFGLKAARSGRWLDYGCLGGAVGLALLTKVTAFVLAPFLVWLMIRSRQARKPGAVRKFGLAGLIVIVVLCGWMIRCWQAKGSVAALAPSMMMDDRSLPCLVANAAKHATSECEVPCRPLMKACAWGVVGVHRMLNMRLDDSRTTGTGFQGMLMSGLEFDEDYAGNLAHVLIVLACVGFLLFKGAPDLRAYALACVAADVLFIAFVKWNPWVNRLHLVLFLIAMPAVGIVFTNRKRAACVLAIILVALAAGPLFYSDTRPVVRQHNIFNVPRAMQYFWKDPELFEPYQAATRIISGSGCRSVGVFTGIDSWEYPLWALTNRSNRVYRHVSITDGVVDPGTYDMPCLLLTIDAPRTRALSCGKDCFFVPLWAQDNMQLLRPEQIGTGK